MKEIKLEFAIMQYLPYSVKFSKVVNTYYGGKNPNSYPFKRGKFAHMQQRIGTVTGITGNKIRTTIGYFDYNVPEMRREWTHVTTIEETKLVLRPMSDLPRDEVYKLFDDHVDYITTEREYWIKCSGIQFWLDSIPVSHYRWLLENHYDVFGLIDRGLAIAYGATVERKEVLI